MTDVNRPNNEGRTQLHLACLNDNKWQLIRELIEDGADIDAQDENGQTALHLAVYHKQITVINVLLEKGADTGIKDLIGRTPLYIAIENCDTKTHKILRLHHAIL